MTQLGALCISNLCATKPNHSDRFYQLLGQVMPDWEVVKERLENMAVKFFE
ncbi:YgjP-like metallopeptidase domain-containing protein [Acinetobacter sp. BMW17]|uniref:YgjP-like metallopeptidase domain-containing protein n=1 Tax=Acinetobacter sp. BMW17 TaxID=1795629 RepID=UPI001F0A2279|nr:YgjP-like metallopeptidase domain-containing protein [Acinetobacter sp. BMW17]